MRRTLNIVLIAAVLFGAAIVYRVKSDARSARIEIAELNQEIEAERDAIAILKAEWSLLNQPNRLQDVLEQYGEALQLAPLEVDQIASISDIPDRPAELLSSDETGEPVGEVTGSVSNVVR